MYFASSSFAPMHMMNNSKGRKKRFEQNGQPTSCTDSGHGTCTGTSFTLKLKPVYYMFIFSLTGSMIVLVGWHNLRYIRTDRHADSLFYSQGPCGLPQNFPPGSPSNCPWWELYLQVSWAL